MAEATGRLEELLKVRGDNERWPKGTPVIGGQWRPEGMPDSVADLVAKVFGMLNKRDDMHMEWARNANKKLREEDWGAHKDSKAARRAAAQIIDEEIVGHLRFDPEGEQMEAEINRKGGSTSKMGFVLTSNDGYAREVTLETESAGGTQRTAPDGRTIDRYTAYVVWNRDDRGDAGFVEEVDVDATDEASARELAKVILERDYLEGGHIVEMKRQFGMYL